MKSVILESPLVSTSWLLKHKEAENLIILDGTINKVFNPETLQIPNARLFDIKKKFSNIIFVSLQSPRMFVMYTSALWTERLRASHLWMIPRRRCYWVALVNNTNSRQVSNTSNVKYGCRRICCSSA